MNTIKLIGLLCILIISIISISVLYYSKTNEGFADSTQLATARASLATAKSSVSTAQTSLSTAQSAYNTANSSTTSIADAKSVVGKANTAVTDATSAYTTATTAVTDATNAVTAASAARSTITISDLTANKTAAETAYNNAVTAYNNANTAYNNANTDLTNATTAFNTASTEYTNAVNNPNRNLGYSQGGCISDHQATQQICFFGCWEVPLPWRVCDAYADNNAGAKNDAENAVTTTKSTLDKATTAKNNASNALASAYTTLTTADTTKANALTTKNNAASVLSTAQANETAYTDATGVKTSADAVSSTASQLKTNAATALSNANTMLTDADTRAINAITTVRTAENAFMAAANAFPNSAFTINTTDMTSAWSTFTGTPDPTKATDRVSATDTLIANHNAFIGKMNTYVTAVLQAMTNDKPNEAAFIATSTQNEEIVKNYIDASIYNNMITAWNTYTTSLTNNNGITTILQNYNDYLGKRGKFKEALLIAQGLKGDADFTRDFAASKQTISTWKSNATNGCRNLTTVGSTDANMLNQPISCNNNEYISGYTKITGYDAATSAPNNAADVNKNNVAQYLAYKYSCCTIPTPSTGYVGSTGLPGANGASGADGAPGARGPIGDQGLKGLVGPVGDKGAPGAKGDQGSQGNQGSKGVVGINGKDVMAPIIRQVEGPEGAAGPDGEAGPAGPKGKAAISDAVFKSNRDIGKASAATWKASAKNGCRNLMTDASTNENQSISCNDNEYISGYTKVTGYDAAPNDPNVSIDNITQYLAYKYSCCAAPQGPAGYAGYSGLPGADGTDGNNGQPGPMGPRGDQGAKGPKGPKGDQGPMGSKGDQGSRGYIELGVQDIQIENTAPNIANAVCEAPSMLKEPDTGHSTILDKTLSLLNLQHKIRDFIGDKEVQYHSEYNSPSMIQGNFYQHADYSY